MFPAKTPSSGCSRRRQIRVVVQNLAVDHEPLYSVGEQAGAHQPWLLCLCPGTAEQPNDDHVEGNLERLLADPASLLPGLVSYDADRSCPRRATRIARST